MKQLIYAVMIGRDPAYAYSALTFARYARRVNADLMIHRHRTCQLSNIYVHDRFYQNRLAQTEKFHLAQLLRSYDRVLFLDADILITPQARDIFAAYPNQSRFMMFNEGGLQDYQAEIDSIQTVLPPLTTWQRNAMGWPDYYNSGVMLASQPANVFAHVDFAELSLIFNKVFHYDQTYINYLIQKHQIPMQPLEANFNRMCQMPNPEARFDADFIHYAGFGYADREGQRSTIMIRDYEYLYGKRRLSQKLRTVYDHCCHRGMREVQSIRRRLARLR